MLPDRSFTCVSDRSKEAEELHNLPVSTHSLLPATSLQDTPRAGLRTWRAPQRARLTMTLTPRAPGALALSLTEAVDFLDLGARASKKVEHWRARLCGKQRKSTASVRERHHKKLSCLVSWERVRAPLRGISDWNRASRFPSAQAHASVQLSGVMFSSLA